MKILDYKVGDKVKIRNIPLGTSSSGYLFIDNMQKYIGTTTKIIEIHDWVIRLECTGRQTGWVTEWLAPADFLTDMDFDI